MRNAEFSRAATKLDIILPDVGMVAASLVEHISAGIIFVDETGIITFVNPAVERLLGIRKGEVVGKQVDMLPLRNPLYKILSENSREFPVELSVNGRVVLVKSSEIGADGDGIRGELVEMRDITAEKKERRQREEFVAMMTHDLKSPLTVMMGYIQAMREEMVDAADPTLLSCVEELDRSSYRLLGMIEDVLDAYRLEVGLLSITREDADLGGLLAGCCRDAARTALGAGIELTTQIPDHLPLVCVDRKQIVRVFANLLGNAIKFTSRRGVVSLAAASTGEFVTVTVADSGIGIPEKEQARIFNKYFRASTAAGYKGTGLGLAISKAIVDAHNGRIEVESREGEGSRFTVMLPVG